MRRILELTIDIHDPETNSKIISLLPAKVEFEIEGNSQQDLLDKTEALRRRLHKGTDIYFTRILDQVETSEAK